MTSFQSVFSCAWAAVVIIKAPISKYKRICPSPYAHAHSRKRASRQHAGASILRRIYQVAIALVRRNRHPGPFHPVVAHEVKHRFAARHEVIGDDAAVAAPPDGFRAHHRHPPLARSEEHTSELQSLMRTSSAVFC